MNHLLLKSIILAALFLYITAVWAQDDDLARLMRNINAALSEGECDCEKARRNYNAWKDVTQKTDKDIETRISNCFMQKIRTAISEGNCDEAQRNYDSWKGFTQKTNNSIVVSIKNCFNPPDSTPVKRARTNHSPVIEVPEEGAKKGYDVQHGITIGYIGKRWEYNSRMENRIRKDGSREDFAHSFRIGYTYQQHNDKGVGLATGINVDTYYSGYYYYNDDNDRLRYASSFYEWAINLPIHVSFRTKSKLLFIEAGPSFDIGVLARHYIYDYELENKEINFYGIANSWDDYPCDIFYPYMDISVGFQIQNIQIKACPSLGLKHITGEGDLNWKLNLSLAWIIPSKTNKIK